MACPLYAITVFASGSEAVASAPGTAFDATGGNDLAVTASYTSGTILVNDNDIEDGKGVVFSGNNTADMNIEAGIVKVGTAGAKTCSGATTVKSGAILQITAASAGSIAGDIEIKAGGILMVDSGVEIPASGPSYLFLADRVYNLHTNLAENVSAAYTAPDPAPKLHCSLAAGLPVGSTINPSTGTVTLPAPSGSTTSYNVSTAGISAEQADTITAIPTGWTYDSGAVKLLPAIGTAGGFPASTTLAADGGGITLPGGHNAQSDGIHKPNDPIVTKPIGFTFSASGVACDSSAINLAGLPSGSSLSASSADGVDVMLPTGYSFDSANLYNGLTKGAVFPAGFANSNALGSYRKLVDGNAIAQGARDCTDVIVGNLQLRPGSIIKLGAGAKWSRNVTVA